MGILETIAVSGATGGLVVFLLRTWITERLRQSISHEYAMKLSAAKNEFEKELEIFKREAAAREAINQFRWQTKREACLEALRIIDGELSNRIWDEGRAEVEKQDRVPVQAVRECYNRLTLACDSDRVLIEFKRCLGIYGPTKGDVIVDLRSAIREELGFGQPIDTDRQFAWIGRLSKLPKSEGSKS